MDRRTATSYLTSFHLLYTLSLTFLYLCFEMSKVVQPLRNTPVVCSYFTWWFNPHHSLFLWQESQHCSLTLSPTAAEKVYCITSTATSCSSCPHNTHCSTLSEYAQEAEVHFTSMVFLPGDHVLEVNIRVANVTTLTMHGESSSRAVAPTPAGPAMAGPVFCST